MASSTSINEKHMAAINDLKQEYAVGKVAPIAFSSVSTGDKSQVTTAVLLKNAGVGEIKYLDSTSWSGKFLDSCPPTIPVTCSERATHQGKPPTDPEGSIGVAVFVGPKTQDGSEDVCAYVVAWSAMGDGSPNKVLVKAAPSSEFPKGKIVWAPIIEALKKTTKTFDRAHDVKYTGAYLSAEIDETGNTPNLYVIMDVVID